MTREAFELVYQQSHRKAVEVARKVCGARDVAEDAVQEAAVYFLERLEQTPRITSALFIHRACQRAKDRVRRDPRHASATRLHELPVGHAGDLDGFLYGPEEDAGD